MHGKLQYAQCILLKTPPVRVLDSLNMCQFTDQHVCSQPARLSIQPCGCKDDNKIFKKNLILCFYLLHRSLCLASM